MPQPGQLGPSSSRNTPTGTVLIPCTHRPPACPIPTETEVTLDDLRAAGEAFLANVVMGVMTLIRLARAAICGGRAGLATQGVGDRLGSY